MEKFLVSAATGALKPVLQKLAAVLGDEYNRFKGVRGEVKSLTEELGAMHAFLLKMSEEENPDAQDKAWMKEVRELSYDIEDSLDEFMLRVDDKSTKPDGFIDKCKNLVSKTKTRRRIAKAIQDLKVQVKEVGDRSARYKTGQYVSKTSHVSVDQRALAIFEDSSKLVGIDGPKNELIRLLIEDDGRVPSPKPKVISIVGFGGLGKTTLANQVYQELKGKFDCGVFVSVSRNPDITKVLRIILSKVSKQPYANTKAGDIQQLISKIINFLQDKRYLVVVDDVWSADAWNIIKCIFQKGGWGSRIMTTTRINDLAKSCCSTDRGHVYSLKPLSDMDSRILFLNRIFGSGEQCPSHLNSISEKILKKCGGLPLAIIAVCGLLANKAPTVDQWDQVETSIGCALERNKDIQYMMAVLSLSYLDLPPSIKSCLLYLSIFPEDYMIDKKSLVMRWAAEGLISEEHGHTQYELGLSCFNELINRSLIQPGERNNLGELKTCRVHDTILDFIISKSKEENFVTLFGVPGVNPEPGNKVRRLSLQYESEIPTDLVLSSTRSLTAFEGYVKIPSLFEFRNLRVLDFEGYHILQEHDLAHIGTLYHLKYLSLKGTNIYELPEKISELQYLETLNIEGTLIDEIPSTIARLWRLIHLLVVPYAILPAEIGGMQALQVLENINVFMQSIYFVPQLGQLTNLRKLRIDLEPEYPNGAEDCKEHMKEMTSAILKLDKANLYSLMVYMTDDVLADFFMESWCSAPGNLRRLHIWYGKVSRVPRWMGSLVNLQKLVLPMKNFRTEDVVTLGGLPALVYLFVPVEGGRVEDEPEGGRLRISHSHGFPSLRHFRIGGQCGLGLSFEAGSMPRLQKLELVFGAEATYLLTNGDFDFSIEHLSRLATICCHIYFDSMTKETAEAAMNRAISAHPNHLTFTMHEI